MASPEEPHVERIWRCLQCRGPLTSDAFGLRCPDCHKQYPVIAGVPILVSEPAGYMRSEIAMVDRAACDARLRRDILDKIGRDAGLPKESLDRHRDVIDTEIARAETFLALLKPAAEALETLAENEGESLDVRRSGWAFDQLFPYLIRDWTNTSELEAASSVINAALKNVFPDPFLKSIAVAGCGAGGLLERISPRFGRVLGFDLSLPILLAARHLFDGKTLDLDIARSINKQGRICLHKRETLSTDALVELVAMDTFDTAFENGSLDCVITSFMVDLLPDPRRLADEINRVLSPNGVWINYGPSGPLNALWRFDQTEGAAFFEASGFTIVEVGAHRATYLDLSRDCPTWSFQNHMCYLTSVRKTGQGGGKTKIATPVWGELSKMIPQHFPGANLIHRQRLGTEHPPTILLRHERIPGRMESLNIGSNAAQAMALVDGKRTVQEIADSLKQRMPTQPVEETIRAFERYFNQGLLTWRDPDR